MNFLFQLLICINLGIEPTSLDPRHAYDPSSTTLALMLGEGLTRIDVNDKPVMALAESVEIRGLLYRFHLRKAEWSDGQPVTAEDFVRSWREALDPSFPCDWVYLLDPMKNFWAEDERTLIVELKKPNHSFLELVAAPPYLPYRKETQCGPFRLKIWDRGRKMIAQRNPAFWDADHVGLDEVEMLFVACERTELYMFEQGEIDWAGAPNNIIPFDAVPLLRNSGQLHARPVQVIYLYKFNTRVPPLNNAKVRRALSAAIPRAKMATYISQETHRPAYSFIPHSKHRVPPEKQARKLFDEGLKELGIERKGLEISFNTNDDHLAYAQAIQQHWQKVFDIQITLSGTEWRVHLSRLQSGAYEVGRHAWMTQVGDSSDYLTPFQPGNDMGWDSPYVNEATLIEEMPAAPLFFLTYNYLCNPRLQGAFITQLGRLELRWAGMGDLVHD